MVWTASLLVLSVIQPILIAISVHAIGAPQVLTVWIPMSLDSSCQLRRALLIPTMWRFSTRKCLTMELLPLYVRPNFTTCPVLPNTSIQHSLNPAAGNSTSWKAANFSRAAITPTLFPFWGCIRMSTYLPQCCSWSSWARAWWATSRMQHSHCRCISRWTSAQTWHKVWNTSTPGSTFTVIWMQPIFCFEKGGQRLAGWWLSNINSQM